MLPGLERLRLAPTGCDDCGEEHGEGRNVRARVAPPSPPDLSADLVRLVLDKIDAGDAKSACREASAWCAANRNHREACLDAGPTWVALTRRVFTANAPTLNPIDARANFNALCNRLADYAAGRSMLHTHPAGDALVRPFVRAAVQFDPVAALAFAPAFRADRPLMQEAVQIDGRALQFGFGSNVEMCTLAVAQNGLALQYVARHLRTTRRNITLRAVQQNGLALAYALDPVRLNEEVVFAAVRQNGNALMYATSYRLGHQDYDLVMEAVKNKGRALRWAGWLKRDDENIVRAAVTDDGSAIEYASPRLQADEAIRAIAAAQIRYGESAEGSGVVAF